MAKKIEREGLVFKSKYNEKYTVIDYKDNKNVIIEFENGYIKKCRWIEVEKGSVINPYTKTICEVGFLGEGEYHKTINRKNTKTYVHWLGMLQRCYSDDEKNPTYIDCEVCEEWHNFQNFAKWYEDNYYEIEGEEMCLDKDILCKGNKIYSPQTCVFVPKRINSLFTTSSSKKVDYPIGVYYHKDCDKLIVQCGVIENNKKKLKHLGLFPLNKPFQAFTCYKNFKEKYIKQVADEYKHLIPSLVYEAMYNWVVEIND